MERKRWRRALEPGGNLNKFDRLTGFRPAD
jgi:hypothetical protein